MIISLALPSLTFAQGLGSGSGSGTGTGRESGGFGATGTGMESGGLGATSGRRQSFPFIPPLDPLPGINGPRIDPELIPLEVNLNSPSEILFDKEEPLLVREALGITDPGERSLALVRIARTSIFLERPDLGHIAVVRAAQDSLLETNDTIRDQRLVNVIQAMLGLAEEHMREVVIVPNASKIVPPLPKGVTLPKGVILPKGLNLDRDSNLKRGSSEWVLAYRIAFRIKNQSARAEMLYRVVESESVGSRDLVREPARLSDSGLPDPNKLAPNIRNFADRLLVMSIEQARTIERPAFRDRALVTITSNAASSAQFERAAQAAGSIPQPEVRSDGFLKLAENLTAFGRVKEATEAYSNAAQAVAAVPNQDPRDILVGVLIDSLIASGRFEDARASVVLYTNPANPAIALAAVAESQGKRELGDSARAWISKESDPVLRSLLYRKLNDGLLYSIEQKRASELSP
jgi:hypothetical protein